MVSTQIQVAPQDRLALRSRRTSLPLRVCMVSYSIYDFDNRVRRYAETLVRQGCEVDAVALRSEPTAPAHSVIKGVNVYRIQTRIKDEKNKFDYLVRISSFFLRAFTFLTREQFKRPYDLVHVHSVPDCIVFAAAVPKWLGAKVILDIHDVLPEFYASKFNAPLNGFMFKSLVRVEKFSAAFSDHVIAANHIWEKRMEARSVPPGKLTTILNFPDSETFRRRGRTRQDGKFILIYPGTLNYHQGLDIAVRAFALIKDQIPEAEFHIYGSGNLAQMLQDLIVQLELTRQVKIKGQLPTEEMTSLIENADLGVVPKRKDGFGNEAFSTKILEFMSLGVPVIVPDTDIDKYYFNDSVARFFTANDETSLAAAMLELIKNPEIRKRLVRNSSEFVKNYMWDVNQTSYLDLVDRLVNPAPARGSSAIA
jgi:glycosyltransferase involved in cell wall biosynthesis